MREVGAETSVRIEVIGRVQGVGFRAFVTRTANAYDIGGWVRNCIDGSVEILAGGDEQSIRGFIEQIEIGPRAATVERVIVQKSSESVTASQFRIHT